MAVINESTTRILNRGNIVESPNNTFTWTPSEEATIKTGITSLEIVANMDGSYIADVSITFLADNLATYASTYDFDIVISGDYVLRTAFLNSPVANIISDSLVFSDENSYNDFISQLNFDLSIELITENAYY